MDNTLPIVSEADAAVVFNKAAPLLAKSVVDIAMRRLAMGDTESEDSGLEIVSKFKKQLFSERPSVSVALQGKMGVISEDAQARLNNQLGRGREVVAEATLIKPGDS